MKRLKKELDKKSNNNEPIPPSKINKKNIKTYVENINNKYANINTDPLVTNILQNIKEQKLYIDKEKFKINKDIKNLQDLIDLINENPLINNIEYNLDLKK